MNLTKEQIERLALLSEECAEVIQCVTKIIRFGYDSHKPSTGVGNKDHLELELGDLTAIIDIMIDSKDISAETLKQANLNKLIRINKYLKFNEIRNV
jgi:NTP pyrophosphatase (non-canonical NTP hydrolase)